MVAALIPPFITQMFTPEEYLRQERESEFRSEYVNGQIFAMSGGPEPTQRSSSRLARNSEPSSASVAVPSPSLICVST